MHSLFSSAVCAASLIATTLAAPALEARDPAPNYQALLLNDNPTPPQIRLVEEIAHGTIPNGPLPQKLSPVGVANLQLIEFNENFERAYFASLYLNITQNVPGYEIEDDQDFVDITSAILAVVAQEDLHALGAKTILSTVGAKTITPCTYKFPTSTFAEAIAFAATFTDLVLGTLQSAIEAFAENGDFGVPKLLVSVVGQEGAQEGYYRVLQKMHKIPSELPFLTTSTGDFAFSALEQNVIVSCPNDDLLKANLKVFGVLELVTMMPKPETQTLSYAFDLASLAMSNIDGAASYGKDYDWSSASLVLINQQNVPVVEKIMNVKVVGTKVTFDAAFPYDEFLLNGLTIAAVTKTCGPFADAMAVSKDTVFGPALIEIN